MDSYPNRRRHRIAAGHGGLHVPAPPFLPLSAVSIRSPAAYAETLTARDATCTIFALVIHRSALCVMFRDRHRTSRTLGLHTTWDRRSLARDRHLAHLYRVPDIGRLIAPGRDTYSNNAFLHVPPSNFFDERHTQIDCPPGEKLRRPRRRSITVTMDTES